MAFLFLGGMPRKLNNFYGDTFLNIRKFIAPIAYTFTNFCFCCVFLLVYLQIKGNENESYEYNHLILYTMVSMVFKIFWDVFHTAIHEDKLRDVSLTHL